MIEQYKKIFLTLFCINVITFCSAQNFVNGSFELNTGFCIVNGDNATITSNVTGIDAYGCGNEMDLMNNTCGYGTAYEGNYFLCFANGAYTCPDACTMQLDAPLVAGNTYTISYYDRGWDFYQPVPLEVGVSTVAGTAGTIVYTSPAPTTGVWSQRVFSFVAPNSGQYISFAAEYNNTRWTHIDSLNIYSGCSANITIVPADPSLCKGDSISIIALGADNYLWYPSIGLSSTTDSAVTAFPDSTITYTVVGTSDAGCADTTFVTVTINPLPSANIAQSNDSLFSTIGNSYQWYTGGNTISGATDSIYVPATEGYYTVVITNASGCTASDTIYFSLSPQTNFAASDTAICQKFCMDFFDQSGNNPTSWHWTFQGGSPSSSILQNPTQICYNNSGVYDVTLITTNSFGSDTLVLSNYITVYSTPAFPTITINGYVLTSSYSSSYQWQFNSIDIPGATNQSYTVTQTGLYTVSISDENGCLNSATVYVQIVGVNEIGDPDIFIYPNPSEGRFVIEFNNIFLNDVSIHLVNALGQTIYSDRVINDFGKTIKKEIDAGEISNGVYSIEIVGGNDIVRREIVIAR